MFRTTIRQIDNLRKKNCHCCQRTLAVEFYSDLMMLCSLYYPSLIFSSYMYKFEKIENKMWENI